MKRLGCGACREEKDLARTRLVALNLSLDWWLYDEELFSICCVSGVVCLDSFDSDTLSNYAIWSHKIDKLNDSDYIYLHLKTGPVIEVYCRKL